ncbi:tetratricopeptide repeat-containing protein, partial [Cystoisospora suis]
MAFRALLSQPRNAAACSADPAVAVSTSGGGNALTSFLNSVTLDPLRTRQLMDGYDLGMVAHSAPAEGTDPLEGFGRPAFPPDFLDESSSQKPINLHAPHPVSVGQLEAAWLPRDGSTLDTEKRAFHGLGGPETLHFPPALGTTEGTSTSTTTSGNSTISSHNQISQLHSFPSYQFTTPSSSSPLPSFSSTSSLPPVYYPSAPVFSTDERSTYASHQRFHENFSWADEFNVFSQGEKCFHPETEGLQQRKIVPLPSSYGGVSSSSSTGAKETAGEASSAKQQLAEKTTEPFSTVPAPASASLTPSFDVPLYPLTAYPNCPPPLLHELPRMPVPFRELEQQRRRALEAASLAQAAVGIPTVPREAQSSNKVEGLRKEEAEEQKSFITETEKSKDSSKGPCFDQRAAQEMLENLKAMGQEKMEQSEFVHFIRQLASGHLSLVDGQLRDSAGQSVDWNTYVSKSQEGLDHETQRQENGEAREDTKNSMRENKEIEEEKNSPASTEDAGSFERSMKELENAWQRARDNGEIDEEEFQLFKSVFDTAGLSKAFGDAATDEASLMDGLWAPDEQTQGSFKHDDLLGGGDEEGQSQ